MGAETNPEDVGADLYIATFHTLKTESENEDGGTESFSTEARIAERIQLQAGEHPSYAIVTIPMDAFPLDEDAFVCAFVRGGTGDRIKFNTRCTIAYRYGVNGTLSAILTGTVVEMKHDASRDAVIVTVIDDRWILSRITCFGQLQYDPTKSGAKVNFISADPLIFNQNGMPDCMDTPKGPRFAAFGFFGWKSTHHAEPSVGSAVQRARSWRVTDAIEYLRQVHYSASEWPGTGMLNYGTQEGRWVPEQIISWPMGLGQQLVTSDKQSGTRYMRPLHHFSLEGLPLHSALNLLAKRAGPFELTMVPGGTAGDNGNDVDAGLMAADPGGIYATLSAAFTSTVSTMNTAFNNSQDTFLAAIENSQQAMGAAIASFQAGLATKAPPGILNFRFGDSEEYKNLIREINNANVATYKADVLPTYQAYLQKIGMVLEGNAGMYAANNTTDSTSTVATTETSGGGESLKSVLKGLEESKSTIAFVSYDRKGGSNHLRIPGLSDETLDQAMGSNMIHGGYVTESIRNYYHKVLVLGDAPFFEILCDMEGSPEPGWEVAWTPSDELALQNYIDENGQNRDAFEEATRLWPLVYCAYRVPEDFNYMQDSKWKDQFKYRGRKHPRIKSTLLTSMSDDETSDGNPANFQPRDIPIEAKIGGTWRIVTYYNNLELSHDGSIVMLKALRDSDDHPTWSGAFTAPFDMAARSMRATLAIQGDFRLTAEAGGTNEQGDPNGTMGRVYSDHSSPITTYIAMSNPLDYIEWLRHESAQPVGSRIPAASRVFPARCADGEELFTDRPTSSGNNGQGKGALLTDGRMVSHALSRLSGIKRIEHTGQIAFARYDPGIVPGVRISGITDSGIPVIGAYRSVTLLANSQEVLVEMG